MKQLDELDLKREQDAEFTGDTFTSRFAGDYFLPQDRARAKELQQPKPRETAAAKKLRLTELKTLAIDKSTLRWSHFKELPASEMLTHVQQKVFPFIKDLQGDGSNFTRHMANAVFLIPSANLLQGAVAIIEDIFLEIERDAREEGHLFQDIQGQSLQLNTTKTELLFTERIFTLLKTGGTAGIIIPQGVLFGSGKAFVEARKKLVEEAIAGVYAAILGIHAKHPTPDLKTNFDFVRKISGSFAKNHFLTPKFIGF